MVANFALLSFPLLVIALFTRYGAGVTTIVSVVVGYLLLPSGLGFDFPLLPVLDQATIPILTLLALALFGRGRWGQALPGWLPGGVLAKALLGVMLLGAFFTVLSNQDRLFYGDLQLPAMRIYDGFSVLLETIMVILPLLLARKFLSSPDMHLMILKVLVFAGLAYSLLVLIELRLSPILSLWIYGFFPHSFLQHIRGDGYRPIVFMPHGLVLAIFMMASAVAAFGLARSALENQRMKFFLFGCYLAAVLVLCKSLGALLIAFILVPVVFFLRPRTQLLVAAISAVIFLTYPASRAAGLIPVTAIYNIVVDYSPERAQSLGLRLDNEDRLLAKAAERPLFGWGGWGRARVYSDAGDNISVTDGYWVILIGEGGWVQYVSKMGLLALPLVLLFWRRRTEIPLQTSALALILAGNLIDLVPNGWAIPSTWLIAGALWGALERPKAFGVSDEDEEKSPQDSAGENLSRPALAYTRQSQLVKRHAADKKAQETVASRGSNMSQRQRRADLKPTQTSRTTLAKGGKPLRAK